MVTVTSDSDKEDNERTGEKEEEDTDNKIQYIDHYDKVNGYDYNNLYGLLALPLLGLLISLVTYFLKKYRCLALIRLINFIIGENVNQQENDSYGSHSTATPPIILFERDFSGYNTSQTSTYASTKYSDKEIQTSLPSIDPDCFDQDDFSETISEKENGSSLDEEDIIYINIKEEKMMDKDEETSTTRSGIKYK